MLAENRTVLGVIVTIPSVQVVQALAQTPLDFIIIDMEHGPIDFAAAHAMIAATSGTRLTPFVRITHNTVQHAKLPLDLGAMGICFPMISTREDAEAAARAVRYPPAGERYWGPFYASMRYGQSIPAYLESANREIMTMGTIEHIDAVSNLPEIVSTPGVDSLAIGPGDLATSMGLGGQINHPDVQAAIASIEKIVLPSKVPLGGVAHTAEQLRAMTQRGYKIIVVGFDWSILQRGVLTVTGSL